MAPDAERRRTRPVWRVLVPLTFVAAGALFGTSRETAQGTDLRGGRFSQLTDLISATQQRVADDEQQAAALRREVNAGTATAAQGSSAVARARARGDAQLAAAGLTPVHGPGLVVSLDDAPRSQDGAPPASSNPDDLVVHQQDVQSVLNALWAGGAEAVSLMGERMVSTSAVRCVGNTLLVQGRLVGPPWVLRAIGAAGRVGAARDAEPRGARVPPDLAGGGPGGVVTDARDLRLPAYEGPLELPHVSRS